MKKSRKKPDVVVERAGSNQFMFRPVSAAGKAWVEEHVELEGWQWIGGAFAVDHRYAMDLSSAMTEAGLVVL